MSGCKKRIKIGGKRIECVRFADDTVLLAENERVMNSMQRI